MTQRPQGKSFAKRPLYTDWDPETFRSTHLEPMCMISLVIHSSDYTSGLSNLKWRGKFASRKISGFKTFTYQLHCPVLSWLLGQQIGRRERERERLALSTFPARSKRYSLGAVWSWEGRLVTISITALSTYYLHQDTNDCPDVLPI